MLCAPVWGRSLHSLFKTYLITKVFRVILLVLTGTRLWSVYNFLGEVPIRERKDRGQHLVFFSFRVLLNPFNFRNN